MTKGVDIIKDTIKLILKYGQIFEILLIDSLNKNAITEY
jgi:hypothetical protein